MNVPIPRSRHGALAELAGDSLSPARLGGRGLVAVSVAQRLLTEHRSRRANQGLRLDYLLVREPR